jgi:hypothetical protein
MTAAQSDGSRELRYRVGRGMTSTRLTNTFRPLALFQDHPRRRVFHACASSESMRSGCLPRTAGHDQSPYNNHECSTESVI